MAEQNFRLDYQRNTTDAPAFCCVVCTRTFIFHADEVLVLQQQLLHLLLTMQHIFQRFTVVELRVCLKGQYEAGQVLGMTKTQIFFKIILLQVIKENYSATE